MNVPNIEDSNNFRDLDTAWALEQLRRASTPTEAINLIQSLSSKKITAPDSHNIINALIEILSHHHPAVPSAAVEALVTLVPDSVEPLITAFHASKDHALQAYIVQALAKIGDDRALDLLLEVIGVAVANHCQGNVRRVAARGLAPIASNSNNPKIIQGIVEKLVWALEKTEDWALRYAAAVSLEEIATFDAISALKKAAIEEEDSVVKVRIKTALE